MHPHTPTTTVVISVVAFAAGCGYDPLDQSTQIRPSRGAIVGIWQIDEKATEPIPGVAKSRNRASLNLTEDGTFSARNLPYWWNDMSAAARPGEVSRPVRTLTSTSGKWSLVQARNAWVVSLDFPAFPDEAHGRQATLYLHRQEAPYHLGVILGDPDEGRWLIFVRTGPASAAGPEPAPPSTRLKALKGAKASSGTPVVILYGYYSTAAIRAVPERTQ